MAAKEKPDMAMDTLTREHPVGTGVGAAGGAVAGATIGSAGGPIGAVVGGVIGAVAGGLAGRGIAEMANPATEDFDGRSMLHSANLGSEDAYWREAHKDEPYFNPARTYEDYEPAYRLGWTSRSKYENGTFDQYEPAFRNDWDSVKGLSRLSWDEAKHAASAGWHRIERALPGDADGDGR